MPHPLPDEPHTLMQKFEQSARASRSIIPFYLCVPIGLWLVFDSYVAPMRWGAFLIGMVGWTIALILRAPIGLLTSKLPRSQSQLFIVASSGPLEEGVRLCILALAGSALSPSLSVGQGWAAMEVLYTILTLIMVVSLAKRNDEKAQQAKLIILQQQGNRIVGPFWGVLERITASAFHIGASLLVAREPTLVVVMLPLHSLLNLGATRLVRRSMMLAECFIAVVGLGTLAWGLAAFGQL